MIELLQDFTGATTGSEPYLLNQNAGSFMIICSASTGSGATALAGTLDIEMVTFDDIPIVQSTELSFTALPEPKLVYIPSSVKVRAQGTGITNMTLRLLPADSGDSNRGRMGRI